MGTRESFHRAFDDINNSLSEEFEVKKLSERDWKAEIDLIFLESYLTGDKELQDEDVVALGNEVASVLTTFSQPNTLRGDKYAELMEISEKFDEVISKEDFDDAMQDLYDFGDSESIWIKTSEVMGESKKVNERKKLSEKCGTTKTKKMKKKSAKEAVDTRGKRDGTGPHRSSLQRRVTGRIGKRKARGEKCPAKESYPDGFNEEQIKMGIGVEMEHTDDAAEARKIALDHLEEDSQYYTKLKKLESTNETKAVRSKALKEYEFDDDLEGVDPAGKLEYIIEMMWELNDLALEAVEDGDGDVDQARYYWYAHIQGALDKNRSGYLGGSMIDMQSSLQDLQNKETVDELGDEEEDVEEGKVPKYKEADQNKVIADLMEEK